MTQINPYLNFNGDCEAAFKFYEQALGGKIEFIMRAGDSPMCKDIPPERQNMILHVRLSVGGSVLMGSDAPPDRYEAPKGTWVSLGIDEPAEADRVFGALAAGGTIAMPIEETFWAQRFGMVVDRFGIPWMINCEKRR